MEYKQYNIENLVKITIRSKSRQPELLAWSSCNLVLPCMTSLAVKDNGAGRILQRSSVCSGSELTCKDVDQD